MASRGMWVALILFALTGCGGSESDGEAKLSPSPNTPIITVPEGETSTATGPQKNDDGAALSRIGYISEADELCGESQSKIGALEKQAEVAARKGDYETSADLLEQGISESEREVAALRDLPAPEGSEAILSQMYADVEEVNRLFRRSLDDLRSGDVPGFNSLGDEARFASRRSKRIAIGFGFKVCGQRE